MLKRRMGAIALIIIFIVGTYLLYVNMRKAREISITPAERGLLQKESPVIYEIPANAIPTTEAIEKQIAEAAVRGSAKTEAKAKISDENSQGAEQVAIPAAPQAAAAGKGGVKILPEKKEIRFPTYEERRKSRSGSGIMAF